MVWPTSQVVHEVLPGMSEYLPMGQRVQTADDVAEGMLLEEPAGQSV